MAVFEELQPQDLRRVGPYRIEARLGAGGMGRVFLGRSRSGRAVAVKVVHPELAGDREFRHRFAREIALARTVSGFFTAGVVDADPEGDPPWLATAYVPGLSLDQAVAEHGPWQEQAVLTLGAGLAEALESIHAVGVVHRDLKPSNVLLAADGPRVIDFGISVAVEGSKLTRTGMAVGTPGFISPEQLTGDPVGPASDVFCLGAVLAFTASASGPFGGGSWQGLWYRTVHAEPDLAALPPGLRSIVSRCLDKSPERRPSAAGLLDELADSATDGGTLVELYAESRWLPEPVAHVVRTLVATPATRPPANPGDLAPPPPATVAESADAGLRDAADSALLEAHPSRDAPPTPPAEAPEHGDVVRTLGPDDPDPTRVVEGAGVVRPVGLDDPDLTRVVERPEPGEADRPLASGGPDQRTLIDGTSRPSTLIERTASLAPPAKQDMTSSSSRAPDAGPRSWGRAIGSGMRAIRERSLVVVTVLSPAVLLGFLLAIGESPDTSWPTVTPTSESPEQPRATKSAAPGSKVPPTKAPAEIRFSSPIDYCALLKASQVKELVPKARARADTASGRCNWAAHGRALEVAPSRWFPSTKAAKKALRDWKRARADGAEILWSRADIGVDRVFESVVSGQRNVSSLGQGAFAYDAGSEWRGLHYTTVMFRLDNLVIDVCYIVVDGSENDQHIRQGALQAARWVKAALDRDPRTMPAKRLNQRLNQHASDGE